jgi:hypothetical protein
MNRNAAAVITVILTVGIWVICPASLKPRSSPAIAMVTALIAYPIYRLLYRGP